MFCTFIISSSEPTILSSHAALKKPDEVPRCESSYPYSAEIRMGD